MEMILTTIALLVLFASAFILFSEELRSFAKKLINNGVVRFLGPLLIVSFIVLNLEDHIDLFLVQLRIFVFFIVYLFVKIIPVSWGGLLLGKIITLILSATIPIFIGKILPKKSHIGKLSIDICHIFFIVSVYLWSIFALLLVLGI